jgi:hypothetical protein
MVNLKKSEIGISVYPDFYAKNDLKEQVERAAKLGYTRIFTSIQLGNLGFENTKDNVTEDFQYLFDRCDELRIIIHVDINDRVLKSVGGSPQDLSPIHRMKIKVLRLDGGFTDDEVAQMTNNPFNIQIEENSSMVDRPQQRIQCIKEKGDLKNYVTCHNFFPRNDTGLSFEDTVKFAKLYADQGIQNGVFIASLTSPNDLNASGNGVCTVEEHRYTPAHVAFSELRNTNLFDYILFGDSVPSQQELEAVARAASLDYVEVPVWLNRSLRPDLHALVSETKLLSRPDQPETTLRATQTRGSRKIKPELAIHRPQYAITLDNELSNRYEGELQIILRDLPPTPVANVIGQVKPYGKRLVEQVKYKSLPFKLKEE